MHSDFIQWLNGAETSNLHLSLMWIVSQNLLSNIQYGSVLEEVSKLKNI